MKQVNNFKMHSMVLLNIEIIPELLNCLFVDQICLFAGIRLLFTIICYMFYEQIKEESRQRASILSESGAKYDRLVNEEQTIGERQNTVKAEDGKTVCGKLWSFVVLFMAVLIIIIITCSCLLGLLLVYLICEAKEQ